MPAPEPTWQVAVRTAFQRPGRHYGPWPIAGELQSEGHAVERTRLGRTLAAHGLCAQPPRSFVPRPTDSDPARCLTPNRLLGQAAPIAPNQVWVNDSTYLPKQGGGWC